MRKFRASDLSTGAGSDRSSTWRARGRSNGGRKGPFVYGSGSGGLRDRTGIRVGGSISAGSS